MSKHIRVAERINSRSLLQVEAKTLELATVPQKGFDIKTKLWTKYVHAMITYIAIKRNMAIKISCSIKAVFCET